MVLQESLIELLHSNETMAVLKQLREMIQMPLPYKYKEIFALKVTLFINIEVLETSQKIQKCWLAIARACSC